MEGFRTSVRTYAEALADYYQNTLRNSHTEGYNNKKTELIDNCTLIIHQKFEEAWDSILQETAEEARAATEDPTAMSGGRRARKTHRRRNISDMSWLRRRVNSLSLRNLQREENRLSEEEDHEMPGRGWVRAKKARRTRRRRV
jgi:hypothetical protein